MNNTVTQEELQSRYTKISKILITQSKPADDAPYQELTRKFDVQVDFKPFIDIQSVPLREFRKQKINIPEYTAVIFTSKNAVDHFFKLATEMRVEISPEMKYFCVTEGTANYLQHYITLKKRKIFVGARTSRDLFDLFKKHKTEKYIFPCSDIRNPEIPDYLRENNIVFVEAIIYHTVSANLEGLQINDYDLVAFFSPSGVESLLSNFPDFKQESVRMAAFGPTTAKAVRDSGFILDIQAPLPNAPSMTGAIDLFIKQINSSK